MDYDARISRLETAIQWMTNASSIAKNSPQSLENVFWENSKAKVASEAFFTEMDQLLVRYQSAYDELLHTLQQRKQQLEKLKMELYHYYSRELFGLSEEERLNYLKDANIDPSVRKMLT